MRFNPIDKNVRIIGRTKSCNEILYLGYSCSAIEFEFEGVKAEVVIQSDYVEGDSAHRAWKYRTCKKIQSTSWNAYLHPL